MKCNFQVDLFLFLSRNIGNVSRILFQNFSFTECFHIVVLYFITVFLARLLADFDGFNI